MLCERANIPFDVGNLKTPSSQLFSRFRLDDAASRALFRREKHKKGTHDVMHWERATCVMIDVVDVFPTSGCLDEGNTSEPNAAPVYLIIVRF